MALGFKTGNIAKLVTVGGWQKFSNLSVKTPTAKPKKQLSLLPMDAWLFMAANWEEGERFVEAIALIYITLNQPVELPSLSFLPPQKTDPNNSQKAQSYFNQGQTLKKQGKYQEAVVYFQEAIKADKTYIPAYNNFGTLLQNQGQLKPAISCYQNALKLNPNLPQTITNLASIYLLQ